MAKRTLTMSISPTRSRHSNPRGPWARFQYSGTNRGGVILG